MANTFTIPPELPSTADVLSGQRWRARFSDACNRTQNAAQALSLRGGASQSWPAGMQSSAVGMTLMGEVRVPRWEYATNLRVAMKHTASVGRWAIQQSGGGAPAGVMFGVGIPAMLWMPGAVAIAHTETTIAIPAGTGYVDFEIWRDNLGQLYSLSLSLEPAASPLAKPTNGITAQGFQPAGTVAQGDAGDAAMWYRENNNAEAQHRVTRCWSAWFSVTDRAPSMGFPPPMIALPVWVPRGGVGQTGSTVRVYVKLRATDADPVANPVNCDVLFGYPSQRIRAERDGVPDPTIPAAPGLRWGRLMDELASSNAAGEWLTTSFPLPRGYLLHEAMPGGYVNVSNDEGLIFGRIESISAWIEE